STARSTGCSRSTLRISRARPWRPRAPDSSTARSRISRTPIRATRTPGSSTGWRPTLRLEDHPGGRSARALALPLGEGEGLVDVGERQAVRDDLRERVLVLGAHKEIEGGGHDPRVVVHEPRPVDLLGDDIGRRVGNGRRQDVADVDELDVYPGNFVPLD